MADVNITLGDLLTIATTLAPGTNIDFLNNPAIGGEVVIAPAAIEVATSGGVFPTLVSAGIGGSILNFQPGDAIDIQNIDQVFAELNVSPFTLVDDAIFDADAAIGTALGGKIFIAPNGAVTDNFLAPIDSGTQQVFDELRTALFGTAANDATLTFALTPTGFLNSGPPDAVMTTDTAINPCFTPGTRILTTNGDVAVENLAIGDTVITRRGEEREIIWIGRRDIDIARHPSPEQVLPIIIEAGALAENCPSRRLTLSPDHGLYIDGVLVQPKDLLNGVTIRQATGLAQIRYFHVELECHDILFAEGAAAESYLDTGHRGVFDNAGIPVILHPDLMQIRRETEGCAPLCTGGETLFRIRNRLAHRTWQAATLAAANG